MCAKNLQSQTACVKDIKNEKGEGFSRHRVSTLCPKNIFDIFDCNLKTNYQILIIFGTNIVIKWPFSFQPHPMYVSALPRESRSSEICVKIKENLKKNITNIIDKALNKN